MFKKKPAKQIETLSRFLLIALFFFAIYAHVFVDLRYFFVMQNNHSDQALHYRFASLWSHHETSLFIWIVILNLTTYVRKLPLPIEPFRRRILSILNGLLCFYLMVESNPFSLSPGLDLNAPGLGQQGQGLNPLLYDLNMVWHPPLLYLGVTMLFTPYVLSLWYYKWGRDTIDENAIITMIQKRTKIAFGILTLAIGLGSFWAFTQLGWGGFWFWDPVETASLLPWIAALIVFHIPQKTLKNVIWISGVPFAFVMISFWAVRSGMLVSVHSFSEDAMAFLMLGVIALFVSLPLIGITLSRKNTTDDTHKDTNQKTTSNAPTSLKLGLNLFALTLVFLTLGLFVPILFNFSLEPTFFNQALLPIWGAIAIGMATFPYTQNRRPWCAIDLLALLICIVFYKYLSLPFFLLSLAGFILLGRMLLLLPVKPHVALAHIGVALGLIGLASYSDNPAEVTLMLERGKTKIHGNYVLDFRETTEQVQPFLTQLKFMIHMNRADVPDSIPLELTPSKQFFHTSERQRVKASFGYWDKKIVMISNIEQVSNDTIAITLHEKQGLLWLVLGGAMIVIAVLASSFMRSKNRHERV